MGNSEQKYVKDAFASSWITTAGANVDAFETEVEKRFGVHALAVCSGTAGLHLALRLVGVKEGDEVIVPTLTFVGTCSPLIYLGAKPVFLDCSKKSVNLDPHALIHFLKKRADCNKLPRAIIVVHLFGESADMHPILDVASRYEIPVIEDAAEAVGATYKGHFCGTMAALGVYSFNGNKIITTGGGGMLLGSKKDIEKARHWSAQARDEDPEKLGDYWHSDLGYNYRMSNVLAGIGRGQMEVLNDRIHARRKIAERYEKAFDKVSGITITCDPGHGLHTRWLSCFMIQEEAFGISRNALIHHLRHHRIDCRPIWKPLHTQPFYQSYDRVDGQNAEAFNRDGLCLPSSSSLSREDQDRIISLVLSSKREYS